MEFRRVLFRSCARRQAAARPLRAATRRSCRGCSRRLWGPWLLQLLPLVAFDFSPGRGGRRTESVPLLRVAHCAGASGPTIYASSLPNILGICVNLVADRSEEHTSAIQSIMRIAYAVFCVKKHKQDRTTTV